MAPYIWSSRKEEVKIMSYKRFIISVLLGIGLTALAVSFAVVTASKIRQQSSPKTVDKTQEKAELQYEIVLECEKLSSQAVNSSWSYTDCLKNLKSAKSFSDIRSL